MATGREHHGRAQAELDVGELNLQDDPRAPKWFPAFSVTPRMLAARAAVGHNDGAAACGGGGDGPAANSAR